MWRGLSTSGDAFLDLESWGWGVEAVFEVKLAGEGAAVFVAVDEGDIAMVIGLMEVGAWL